MFLTFLTLYVIFPSLVFSVSQTLLGHESSVRSLSFSPCSSMLCSGCLLGEVRLWSVSAATCLGSYHAHRGSTESLNFIQGGKLLLSAGYDHVVRNRIRFFAYFLYFITMFSFQPYYFFLTHRSSV